MHAGQSPNVLSFISFNRLSSAKNFGRWEWQAGAIEYPETIFLSGGLHYPVLYIRIQQTCWEVFVLCLDITIAISTPYWTGVEPAHRHGGSLMLQTFRIQHEHVGCECVQHASEFMVEHTDFCWVVYNHYTSPISSIARVSDMLYLKIPSYVRRNVSLSVICKSSNCGEQQPRLLVWYSLPHHSPPFLVLFHSIATKLCSTNKTSAPTTQRYFPAWSLSFCVCNFKRERNYSAFRRKTCWLVPEP